jgi:hypothetical protein
MQPGEACAVGDQSPDMLLLNKSPAAHIAHIEGIYLLTADLCIINGQDPCLSDHIAQRAVPSLPEPGAAHTND